MVVGAAFPVWVVHRERFDILAALPLAGVGLDPSDGGLRNRALPLGGVEELGIAADDFLDRRDLGLEFVLIQPHADVGHGPQLFGEDLAGQLLLAAFVHLLFGLLLEL